MHFRIQTRDRNALDVLKDSLKDLQALCLHVEKVFSVVFEEIKDLIEDKENLLVQEREGFINATKKKTTRKMTEKASSGKTLYQELQLKNTYNYLLSQLYTNLLLY